MNKSYFCVRHKNRPKRNQHFKTAVFHNKFTFVTSNQISTFRKLNLPLSSSIYFVFLPVGMQKRLKQTKVCHAFSYFV